MTSAAAVASIGTILMIGAKKRNGMKRAPQTTATQPVRPPAPTPAPDSMYVVADDVDDAPPAIAASESTSSGLRISGRSPSFVRYPAGLPTPTRVPIVSKKSDRKSANTQTIADTTPSFEKAWKSKLPKSDQFPLVVALLGHVAVPGAKPAP